MSLVVSVALIGYADYRTGADFEFYVFYSLPVIVSSIYLGLVRSMWIVLLSIFAWMATDHYLFRCHDSIAAVLFNGSMRAAILLFIACFISNIKSTLELEANRSRYDPLTMLYNRLGFNEIANKMLMVAKRKSFSTCLAYIDIDDFKKVNDLFGHNAGDELLRRVGNCMKMSFREEDVVARIGGDEFAVFLTGLNETDATKCIERSMKKLMASVKEEALDVGFSVGVVTFKTNNYLLGDMLSVADDLMYQVKQSGKGHMLLKSC